MDNCLRRCLVGQDTGEVKLLRWSTAIAAAIVVVASWFGVKHYRCQRRNAAFEQRIRNIEKDAHDQLKIGTKKTDVARFYTEHKIPFEVVSWAGGFQVLGTLFTIGGCSPLGCGTDDALIGVRVRVDADGNVVGKPEVVSMYTNCV